MASSFKYQDALRESKKQIVLRALDQARGKYSEPAILLGLHVNNLHRLIKNLGLKEMAKRDRP